MDIEYHQIKDEMARMEHVEYKTDTGISFINVDDIEDFENL